jgi:hypothetical protein
MSTTGIDLAPWQQQVAGHELVESSFMVRNRPIEDLRIYRGSTAASWGDHLTGYGRSADRQASGDAAPNPS